MSPVVNETKLMQIIKIIEINKVKNDFYRYLRSELEIRNSDLVFIAVDKLWNVYQEKKARCKIHGNSKGIGNQL